MSPLPNRRPIIELLAPTILIILLSGCASSNKVDAAYEEYTERLPGFLQVGLHRALVVRNRDGGVSTYWNHDMPSTDEARTYAISNCEEHKKTDKEGGKCILWVLDNQIVANVRDQLWSENRESFDRDIVQIFEQAAEAAEQRAAQEKAEREEAKRAAAAAEELRTRGEAREGDAWLSCDVEYTGSKSDGNSTQIISKGNVTNIYLLRSRTAQAFTYNPSMATINNLDNPLQLTVTDDIIKIGDPKYGPTVSRRTGQYSQTNSFYNSDTRTGTYYDYSGRCSYIERPAALSLRAL